MNDPQVGAEAGPKVFGQPRGLSRGTGQQEGGRSVTGLSGHACGVTCAISF